MPRTPKPAFFAILSDIHANIDALEAVLADIEQLPVRGIFCLGDMVGYGPEPAACVQRVKEACVVSLLGNHEVMLFALNHLSEEDLRKTVRTPLLLAAKQLNAEQLNWLRSLTLSVDLDPMMLSHASLHEPEEFHYVFHTADAEDHFANQTTFINFHGHSHVPMIWEKKQDQVTCYQPVENPIRLDQGNRYAVNVGSVGQPRDQDPRACYALYDHQNRVLLHRRVEYDIARAQARFKKAKLPAQNATRLKKGQ